MHNEIDQASFDSFNSKNQILLQTATLTFRKVENGLHLAYVHGITFNFLGQNAVSIMTFIYSRYFHANNVSSDHIYLIIVNMYFFAYYSYQFLKSLGLSHHTMLLLCLVIKISYSVYFQLLTVSCFFMLTIIMYIAFNWTSLVAQLVKNLPSMQDTLVRFLGREDPLEKEQATYSSILGLPWWLR